MSKLVFRLRNVPEDEAQDVREILELNDISYFETSAGNWGISLPAIWVHEAEKFDQARQLIDEYQLERTDRFRREYQERKAKGEAKTLWHSLKDSPVKFVAFAALIAALLYVWAQAFVFF